jgi:hypothetical protein
MLSRHWLAASLCLVFLSPQSRAADPATNLHQALGSQDPLYKFPGTALITTTRVCCSDDPAHAGEYVALILRSGRNDADAISPALVRAAIEGVGATANPGLVAAIVRCAVSATPTEVLDIVTAAVKASPHSAPAIVTAAVSTVPHPEELVTVNFEPRLERIAELVGHDGKQAGDKEIDNKQAAARTKQVTLAEAIVQAAQVADPNLSQEVLVDAADAGLNTTGGSDPKIPVAVLAPFVPVPPAVSP